MKQAARELPATGSPDTGGRPDTDGLVVEGVRALAEGKPADALRCFETALAQDVAQPQLWLQHAVALAALGRGEAALGSLARTLQLQPDNVDALLLQALLAGAGGRHGEALACLDRALKAAPTHARLLIERGTVLAAMGRQRDAIASFDAALAQLPPAAAERIDALLRKGTALLGAQRYQAAADCFAAILELDGDHTEALLRHAVALGNLERHEAVLACAGRVLRQAAPVAAQVAALVMHGVALGKLDRPQAALAAFDAAIALAPDDAEAVAGRGFALARLNRQREAVTCFDRALELQPGCLQTRYNRALVLLALGDFERGFRDFETRWQSDALLAQVRLQTAAPLWLGQGDVAGRTVLLHHEQGFGDSLQFVRYAPLLAERGARVLLRVPAPLCELFRRLPAIADVLPEGEPLPSHDWHCPLMSLPLAFRTTLQTVPADIPYLYADSEQAAKWAQRLGPATRPQVGLVWAGRQYAPVDPRRDMPLRLLLPLLALDADFISLQKDVPQPDRALLDALPQLQRHGENLGDFADTAALIANLDLVIAVDTSVAHLAAAMGKPVWLLSRFAGCWRWLLQREDSPWYPTLRVFRQPALGDWDAVITAVHDRMKVEIQSGAYSNRGCAG
jgi:tetratricopeptide (TPR) repeat protein